MFKNTVLKKVAAFSAALTMSTAAVVSGTAAPAQATAYGVTYVASGIALDVGGQTVGIPKGQFAVLIEGEDHWVENLGANFISATTSGICDWRIDFQFIDGSNDQSVDQWQGPHHAGCDRMAQEKVAFNRDYPYGLGCADLFTRGIKIASFCHQIKEPGWF